MMRWVCWVPLLAVWTAAGEDQIPGIGGGRLSEFRLENGLRIAVLERRTTPMVAFQVQVGAGASQEPEGKAGISRLIERTFAHGSGHLGSRGAAQEKSLIDRAEKLLQESAAAKDASRVARESLSDQAKILLGEASAWGIPRFFESTLRENGASPVRYSLGADSTTFGVSLTAERAELAFRMWGDWLSNPSWRYFYDERNVLRARFAEEHATGPGALMRSMYRQLFAGHPYEKLGADPEQVRAVTITDAAAFRQAYYWPGNIAIAVVGDVTASQVKGWATAHFGSMRGTTPEREAEPKPSRRESPLRLEPATGMPPQVWMMWRRPKSDIATEAARLVLDEWLTTRGSLGIANHRVAVPGIISIRFHRIPGDGDRDDALMLLAMTGTARHEAVEAGINEARRELETATPADGELSAVRKRTASNLIHRLEDPANCAALLARVLQQEGSVAPLGQLLTAVRSVTPEALRAELAATLLREPDLIMSAARGDAEARQPR
jgi:predicted Zn-dependent peptidase